ncbi:MAG: roadblock/LC7 domain-containing protein [Longimicrobiales bacterium]
MDEFAAALERLSQVPGVRGAMVVDAEAGVPVAAELESGLDGTAVAALTASLFRRASRAVSTAEFGKVHTLQLEGENGHVVACGNVDLAVVVITEAQAQLGRVRLEAQKAAEALP